MPTTLKEYAAKQLERDGWSVVKDSAIHPFFPNFEIRFVEAWINNRAVNELEITIYQNEEQIGLARLANTTTQVGMGIAEAAREIKRRHRDQFHSMAINMQKAELNALYKEIFTALMNAHVLVVVPAMDHENVHHNTFSALDHWLYELTVITEELRRQNYQF